MDLLFTKVMPVKTPMKNSLEKPQLSAGFMTSFLNSCYKIANKIKQYSRHRRSIILRGSYIPSISIAIKPSLHHTCIKDIFRSWTRLMALSKSLVLSWSNLRILQQANATCHHHQISICLLLYMNGLSHRHIGERWFHLVFLFCLISNSFKSAICLFPTWSEQCLMGQSTILAGRDSGDVSCSMKTTCVNEY